MGGNQSSDIKSITSILSQQTTNIMTKNGQNASSDLKVVQSIKVSVGGNLINCGFNTTQTINATQTLLSVVTLQSSSDITATMTAAVQNTMASSQSAIQSFLATAFSNQQSSQDIENRMSQIITNNVSTSNITEILNRIDILQKGEFVFKGNIDCKGQDMNLNQDSIVTQFTSMIVNATTDALMKDTTISDAVNKLTNDQSIVQKGVAEAITAFGLAIFLPLLIIGGVVVLPKLLDFGTTNAPGVEKMMSENGSKLADVVAKNPELLAFRSSRKNKLRMNCCGN